MASQRLLLPPAQMACTGSVGFAGASGYSVIE